MVIKKAKRIKILLNIYIYCNKYIYIYTYILQAKSLFKYILTPRLSQKKNNQSPHTPTFLDFFFCLNVSRCQHFDIGELLEERERRGILYKKYIYDSSNVCSYDFSPSHSTARRQFVYRNMCDLVAIFPMNLSIMVMIVIINLHQWSLVFFFVCFS